MANPTSIKLEDPIITGISAHPLRQKNFIFVAEIKR